MNIANGLVEALGDQKSSGKVIVNCDHCERPAVTHCASCSEFLCDDTECGAAFLRLHAKSKRTAKHEIEPASEGLGAPISAAKTTAHCPEHADELTKLYCRDCKRGICSLCALLHHRTHTCCLLTDVHAELADQLRVAVGGSAGVVAQLQAASTAIAATRDALQGHAATAQQQLDRAMEETIAEVRARFGQLAAEVRGETKTQDAALGEQEAELRRIAGDVQQAQQLAARILEGRADLLVMAPQVLERLAGFDPRAWRLQPVASGEVEFVGGQTQVRAVQAIRELGGVAGSWKAQDWTLQADSDGALLSVSISSAANVNGRLPRSDLFLLRPVFGPGDIRGPAIVVALAEGSFRGQCAVPDGVEHVRIEALLCGQQLPGSPLPLELRKYSFTIFGGSKLAVKEAARVVQGASGGAYAFALATPSLSAQGVSRWALDCVNASGWMAVGIVANLAPNATSPYTDGTSYLWGQNGYAFIAGRAVSHHNGWPGLQTGDVAVLQLDMGQRTFSIHVPRLGRSFVMDNIPPAQYHIFVVLYAPNAAAHLRRCTLAEAALVMRLSS